VGRFVAEIARVLRPGGRALLVVGDGIVDGRAEHAPDSVAAAGAPVGLEPIARASQVRPIHDRRLAAIFADRPRREHLLLLAKRAR
jgi:SAM-dependent methyltransferase